LSALNWSPASAVADVALIAAGIKDDLNPAHPNWPGGGFTKNGILYVPNRGILRALPGDWVAIDDTGWPILVSAASKTSLWTSVP
jgi:hypothetical protein